MAGDIINIEVPGVPRCACGSQKCVGSSRCLTCHNSDPAHLAKLQAGWRRKVETDPQFRNRVYGPVTTQRGAIAPKRAAIERWRERFDVVGECWIWRGAKNHKGYCYFRDDSGQKVSVHRFAYQAAKGPIPTGLVLDHLCRNPACCNPEHLEAVTNSINVLRGKRSALREAPLQCRHGHAYPENERRDKHGRRSCKECSRINGRKYDAARREMAA